MDRFSLTDAQWEKMQSFSLGKPTDVRLEDIELLLAWWTPS